MTTDSVPGASSAQPVEQGLILVVDDDAELRAYIHNRLGAHYRVVEAGSGEDALALARRERPDLVLIDIGLPGKDGFAVSREMKVDERLSAVPLVLMTGMMIDDATEKARRVGAFGVLPKPFNARRLLAAVREGIASVPSSGDPPARGRPP